MCLSPTCLGPAQAPLPFWALSGKDENHSSVSWFGDGSLACIIHAASKSPGLTLH